MLHTFLTQVAITTGSLTDVSPLSSYIYANINFNDLSSDSVSLVSQGHIYFSSVVMQKKLNDGHSLNTEWYPLSISQPSKLTLICDRELPESKWMCNSPRTVDVLFTLPLTSVLTGGPIRIDTIISYSDHISSRKSLILNDAITNITTSVESATVIFSKIENQVELDNTDINTDISHPTKLLREIASSSSFYVSHERYMQAKVLLVIRIGTIAVTSIFFLFWFWSIGVDGFFGIKTGACCCFFIQPCHSDDSSSNKG